jgi:hypothetical protein
MFAILFYRALRIWRNSIDLYRSGASVWRIVAYQLLFLGKKLPMLVTLVVQRRRLAKASVKRRGAPPEIAIVTMGAGLGDEVVAARFVRDLARHCGNIVIDIVGYHAARGRWVFNSIPAFRDYRVALTSRTLGTQYDLVLETTHVAVVRSANDRCRENPALAVVIERLLRFQDVNADHVANIPYSYSSLARIAVSQNHCRSTFLQAQAGISYGGDRLTFKSDESALHRFGLQGRRYLTINTGFDPAFVITRQQATKCYPHFARVVSDLKLRHPDLTIVQIGVSNSIPIEGVDRNLRGQTTLREIVALISHSALHIDNEGGLVHLAASLGVRSCVVFGPTDASYFSYAQNINIFPRFCGGCWWTTESWMDQCPQGFATARCMSSVPPDEIVGRITDALRVSHPLHSGEVLRSQTRRSQAECEA